MTANEWLQYSLSEMSEMGTGLLGRSCCLLYISEGGWSKHSLGVNIMPSLIYLFLIIIPLTATFLHILAAFLIYPEKNYFGIYTQSCKIITLISACFPSWMTFTINSNPLPAFFKLILSPHLQWPSENVQISGWLFPGGLRSRFEELHMIGFANLHSTKLHCSKTAL